MIEKISYTNKATIPSAKQYMNTSPSYTITREINLDEKVWTDEEVKSKREGLFQEMKDEVDGYIRNDFQTWKNFGKDEVNSWESAGHRPTKMNGTLYPHVTSIISPEKPEIPFLEEYGYYGTCLDTMVKNYLDYGKWKMIEYKVQPNIKDNMQEMLDGIQETFKKYKVTPAEHSIKVREDELIYCGELDLVGTLDGQPCIFDIKKTKTLTKQIVEKYFKQIAAYEHCLGKDLLMCILTPYGIKVEANTDKYFHKFLLDRGKYLQRFGI